MCGIFGQFSNRVSENESLVDLRIIEKILIRRGPDGNASYISPDRKYISAHTRLAIIDTTPSGSQPMESACGQYIITFNGEIYNHLHIRSQLEAQFDDWRGTSDTETLLKCIETFGVPETLNKIDGMFAFAVYDKASQKITIARDRLGEKPLYYYAAGGRFVYSSSTRAINAAIPEKLAISKSSVKNFMTVGYVKSPYTVYKNVLQIEPATALVYSCIENAVVSVFRYDTLTDINTYENNANDRAPTHLEEAEKLIENAVDSRMLADVEVGCFLSGGIDSSVIAACMSRKSDIKIHTYSIGFDTPGYDEAPYAKQIAEFLGTTHHEKYVTNKDALQMVSMLAKAYDQPFADASQIPTMLLADFASDNTKVCLSGDGGDEVFGGYTRYIHAKNVADFVENTPHLIKQILAKILKSTPSRLIDILLSEHNFILPNKYKLSRPSDKVEKMIKLLGSNSDYEIYQNIVKTVQPGDDWFLDDDSDTIENSKQINLIWKSDANLMNKMIFNDINDYLQNDILVKVDRASMFHSLEVRAPFLDPALVKFGLGLPIGQKVSGGQGKILLREVLKRSMPKELFDRPKMGFGVPIDLWLRTELRDWSFSLISEELSKFTHIFDVEKIKSDFTSHQNGKINLGPKIWNLLMLLQWNKYETDANMP